MSFLCRERAYLICRTFNKLRLTSGRIRIPQSNMLHTTRSTSRQTEDFNPEDTIKYSASKARDWKSYQSFSPPERDMPWYQPLSVILSTVVFLVYFGILREENDLDLELGKSLYERMPGLEEKQLLASLEYERSLGHSTKDLEDRLKEIRHKNPDS